jgi:dipeptidase E
MLSTGEVNQMKFYLSSLGFGNDIAKLKTLLPSQGRIGHIINAQDVSEVKHTSPNIQKKEIEQLILFGFNAEPLDLRSYFGKEEKLREKLFHLDGVWVSGGNTFVLRQAMKLSGFDIIFKELRHQHNFLYGGYSAGICVLCDSLKYVQRGDDPYFFPYKASTEVVWEGLKVFDYGLLPHYKSHRFGSSALKKDLHACIDNKWLFKVLRDGEVIIIDEDQ